MPAAFRLATSRAGSREGCRGCNVANRDQGCRGCPGEDGGGAQANGTGEELTRASGTRSEPGPRTAGYTRGRLLLPAGPVKAMAFIGLHLAFMYFASVEFTDQDRIRGVLALAEAAIVRRQKMSRGSA